MSDCRKDTVLPAVFYVIKIQKTCYNSWLKKITDLFIATSIDYDKKSEEAYTFFKIVQNKLHYAITGHTAAELIYNRVNAEKKIWD